MADERDRIEQADRLDTFWDGLVQSETGFTLAPTGSPDELDAFTLVNRLQAIVPAADAAARDRIRGRVFGGGVRGSLNAQPAPAMQSLPTASTPPVDRERTGSIPGWFSISRAISFAAFAALLIVAIGGLFALNNDRGWLGSDDPENPPSAPVASRGQATPAALPTQATAGGGLGVIWTLGVPAGDGLEVGATAVVDASIYRTVSTAGFTGVESIDTATGAVKWRKAQPWSGFAIAADSDGVYLINGWNVEALSPEDGAPLWQTRTNAPVSSLTVEESVIYAWTGVANLTRLNAKTGDSFMFYQVDVGAYPESRGSVEWSQPPVAGEETVMAVTHEGMLVGFGKSSGGQLWKMEGFPADRTTLVLSDAGTLVALRPSPRVGADKPPLNSFTLTAINPGDGSVLWEKPILTPAPSVAVSGSTVAVLVDTFDQPPGSATVSRFGAPLRVYGLDLATGDMQWVSDQGGVPYSSVAAYPPDSELVVALSDGGRMTALSMSDGTVVGIHDLGETLVGPIAGNAGGVYPTLAGGALLRVDPDVLAGTTGQQANKPTAGGSNIDWTLLLSMKDGPLTQLGGMAHANGVVYRLLEAGDFRSIQAVHGPTGAIAWQVAMDWGDHGLSADASGVYFVDDANQVVAIDPFDGTALWHLPFNERQVVWTVLADGVLYVWDESSTMTAIDAGSGTVVWEQGTGTPGAPPSNDQGMPAPVVAGHIVAIVDIEDAIHAFDRESGELLWFQPGVEGINARMAHQLGTLFVLSAAGAEPDGTQTLTGTALDLENGEIKWSIVLEGPLVQPVATNETYFYVIANEVTTYSDAAAQNDPYEDYDGPEPGSWTGSRAGSEEPYVGGTHVYGLDAETGEVIWSRSSLAGGFIQLGTGCPNSCALSAMTSDGHRVSLSRESGSISGDPTVFDSEPLLVISGGSGEFGHFATLEDGTLVKFGSTPFSEMG